ncbi:Nitrile hydratase subunit beta [Paraburkholderia sacchari]|uniref:nitrile hydratase subunit beta n=1 Tax=Paraburkholderia sacchari TaxID=159450 RepID=UPI0039A51A80
MNSIHDLGGMHGMGSLPFETNEPLFREDWERSAFAITILLIVSGVFKADEHRYASERIPPLHWLGSPYYLRWLAGSARLLIEKGYATVDEVTSGQQDSSFQGRAAPNFVEAYEVRSIATTNHPVTGDAAGAPRFKVGDKVRAKNMHPKTHTRLPRYVRGRAGTITAHPGAFLYADARAQGADNVAQHTYSVRFEGAELWGPDAGPRDAVYIDLYDTYLEPV